MRVLSTGLSAHVGEHIRLAGCVHAKRDLGALSYVVLRDRAGLVQVVLSEPLELVPETVVEVEGQAVAAAQGAQRCRASQADLPDPRPAPRSRRPSSCAAQW
jgi:nondiscriminating aspartyl-tRNA synthetase